MPAQSCRLHRVGPPGVHRALSDPSISVREATLDLVGQYIALRPEFVESYYQIIARRLARLAPPPPSGGPSVSFAPWSPFWSQRNFCICFMYFQYFHQISTSLDNLEGSSETHGSK